MRCRDYMFMVELIRLRKLLQLISICYCLSITKSYAHLPSLLTPTLVLGVTNFKGIAFANS